MALRRSATQDERDGDVMGFRAGMQGSQQWAERELAELVEQFHIDACLHHQEHRMVNAIRDRLNARLPYGTKLKRICDLVDVDEYLEQRYGTRPAPTFAAIRGYATGVDVAR